MYFPLCLISSFIMWEYISPLLFLSILRVTFRNIRNSGWFSNGESNTFIFSFRCLTNLAYALSSTNLVFSTMFYANLLYSPCLHSFCISWAMSCILFNFTSELKKSSLNFSNLLLYSCCTSSSMELWLPSIWFINNSSLACLDW